MTETATERSEVTEIIADVLQIDPEELDDGTVFGEDVPMESLDYVEIAEMIEFEIGVTIPDEALESIETVGDVRSFVDDRLSE